MSETRSIRKLQLPDLRIRAFRAVGELAIPRLGRVTLIAGRNGVGKTTVLDAVRLYAARGHYLALAKLVERREGLPSPPDGRERAPGPLDFGTLFHGRGGDRAKTIRIGPFDPAQELRIKARPRTQPFSSAGGRGAELLRRPSAEGLLPRKDRHGAHGRIQRGLSRQPVTPRQRGLRWPAGLPHLPDAKQSAPSR